MKIENLKTVRPRAQLVAGRRDWYRIENKKNAPAAEIYVYDEIGYWGVTAQDFIRDLQAVTADEIHLHLNTPGGEVFDGIAIMEALRSHQAKVTTYVDSLAASIGSVIAMAGQRIVMARHATMMIHDGHGICVGNAMDMRELADLLDKTSNNIAQVYAERAGGSVDMWREAMRAETWYSANEAVAAGLADEITAAPDKPEQENSWDLSVFNYAGRDAAPSPVTASDKTSPATEHAPSRVSPVPVLAAKLDPELIRSAIRKAVTI